MIYNQFIDATGEFAGELSFLAKAVSDTETRIFMQHIYVEKSETDESRLRGVATDGRRILIVDPLNTYAGIMGLVPGFWKVLKDSRRVWIARLDDKETKGYMFPAYRKVIPTGEPKYKTTFKSCSLYGRGAKPVGIAKFLHDLPDVTAINLKYLHDLGNGYQWDVEWYGSGAALKFSDNNNRLAVITSMNIY
jgi:hypothetical protein